jgi:hypothetical protein
MRDDHLEVAVLQRGLLRHKHKDDPWSSPAKKQACPRPDLAAHGRVCLIILYTQSCLWTALCVQND